MRMTSYDSPDEEKIDYFLQAITCSAVIKAVRHYKGTSLHCAKVVPKVCSAVQYIAGMYNVVMCNALKNNTTSHIGIAMM